MRVELLRYVALASIAIYLVFDHLDSRAAAVHDEREELIRLKSLELVNKVTIAALSMLALGYVFMPSMNAFIPLFALILSALYTEIAGKLYFRRKL